MIMLWVIWISVGLVLAVFTSLLLKSSSANSLRKLIMFPISAVVFGYALHFVGFEYGGPYIGAAINAAIGKVAVPLVLFYLDNY